MPSANDIRAYDFVMGFISGSKRYKEQFIERFQEVLANFIVDPEDFATAPISRPYTKGQRHHIHRSSGVILKDAETHKAVMTYAANLVLTIMGDRRGEYVKASPAGWEDAPGKAPTATRLMRYAFAIPGTFRTMVEAIVDMLLFGTAVVEINWKYEEREQLVRTLLPFGDDEFNRQRVVSFNDPVMTVVDHQDFFPDPSEYRIENMAGVAKRFKMDALRARELADSGFYRKEAVERAITNMGQKGEHRDSGTEDFREGIDQPEDRDMHEDFVPMIGFEYWGQVPWEDDRGSSRRVVTILNEEIVRDIPYPLADADLPFRALVINPSVGRFYGVSPAEVIRWDQSLQDAIKILLAEAIIRQVHPPIAYDPDSEINLAMLRRWSPDMPIGVRGGPNAVGTISYDAGVFNGFSQTAELKRSMQEASGALAPLQGQGVGSKRASATEAGFAQQQALSRPELAAVLLERDGMPQIARSYMRRFQQYLDDDADLRLRVGDIPQPVALDDIMGDFDIHFEGSRIAMSRQERLQAYDRLVAMTAAIPQAGAMVPWQQLLGTIIGDVMELPEVAVRIADPQVMQQNILLQQLTQAAGSAGNGNGQSFRSQPAAPQAQLTGAAIGNA